MFLAGTSGTSTRQPVAMPWRLRTLRIAASREANEFWLASCSGSGPYSVRAIGIPAAERVASGALPIRS